MTQPTVSKVPMLLRETPFWERTVGNLVHVSEGKDGLSWMSALRDTMVAWFPKLLVSRSLIEISENTFLEFLESGVVYFSVPLSARVMNTFFARHARDAAHIDFKSDRLQKSVTDLDKNLADLTQKMKQGVLSTAEKKELAELKQALPHIVSAKGATILASMVGIGLGCEYLINYTRNLMTAHFFKKDKFSDIVNLSDGHMEKGKKSEVVEKSRNRVFGTLAAMGGTLASAFALARFGHKLPQAPLKGLVKHLDYDIKKGSFSLSKNQFRWYMLASIPAYADGARDKLERFEAVSRLGMIMGYLAWGQPLLEKGMLGFLKKYRGDLYDSITYKGTDGKIKVRELEELTNKAFEKANPTSKTFPFTAHRADEVLKSAGELAQNVAKSEEMKRALIAKNMLFGVPLAAGILGTGVGVTLLGQFWTAYRFNKQQRGEIAPLPDTKQPLSARNNQPGFAAFNNRPQEPRRPSPYAASPWAVQGFSGYRSMMAPRPYIS